MNITPEERDKAIKSILDQGLTPPVPTWAFLKDMYRNLGLRIIFWGTATPIILVILIGILGYIALAVNFQNSLSNMVLNVQSVYTSLFLYAPILFIFLTILTEAMERMDNEGVYELKMTSKYTIRQIAGFRLLCFSLVGTLVTVIGVLSIYMVTEAGHFLQLLSLALCSLFLCSLLIIHSIRRWSGGWYLGAAVWTVANVLLGLLFQQQWGNFLLQLPFAVTLGLAAIAYMLFLREIKKTTREVFSFVDR